MFSLIIMQAIPGFHLPIGAGGWSGRPRATAGAAEKQGTG